MQGVRRLHPVDIEVDEVWVSESATGVPVGYYRIAADETAELDDPWVDPSAIVVLVGHRLRRWRPRATTYEAEAHEQ